MKTIRTQGRSKLVEWTDARGNLRRCVLPITSDDPGLGIPYGLPWEEIAPTVSISPEQLAAELRNSGIWTYEELRQKPNVVIGIINKLAGLSYGNLVKEARQWQKTKPHS